MKLPRERLLWAGIPAEHTANPRKQLGSSLSPLSGAIHKADLEEDAKAQPRILGQQGEF